MKVVWVNMRKYKMTKMPFKFYLPRFSKVWSGKIWQFRILRDYGFDLDFRKGGFKITDLLTEKEKKSFWLRMWLSKRKN